MKSIHPAPLLKTALLADAAASAPLGLLQVSMPHLLDGLLAMPSALLTASGVFLLGYTVLLLVLANSKSVWRVLIDVIIFGNLGWALACLALLAAAPFKPSALGVAYLLLQAGAVVLLAGWEFAGLKASAINTGKHSDRARLAQGQ